MTDKSSDKMTPTAGDVAADPAKPGDPGWVPGRPDKTSERKSGPSCPYRFGF